ncbi:MAG: hypothetical protein KF745_06735 [Phycisphaeraceae bacterium]|nr:hypothetical protein [Phycisphaeraceae bacterium]
MKTHLVRCAAAFAAGLALLGCEEKAPPTASPPATPTPGVAASRGNGALSNLSEQPTSMYGRSAKTGKDTAAGIEQNQARAAGLADEITGQANSVEVAGLVWSVPSEWEKVNAGPMRAAEFVIPGDGAGEANVVWFFFGTTQGGNVKQNLDRWKTMVTASGGGPADWRVNQRMIGGFPVTIAEADGTYHEGMPGQAKTPRTGYAFRGAIVEGPLGNVFIRLTGPATPVENAALQWKSLIDGVRKK